ncbi:MAG: hypothetical protein M0T84_00355 [Betaproteobacteria bacterium]|nr:hypothetical protein [Betaproteobacteria bacterium]
MVYRWFRSPRNFLVFLCAFIVGSITFHRLDDYDPDLGITNLILSIEASVASAGILLVLEQLLAHLLEFLKAWKAEQREQADRQARMLQAVLAIAEAQRDMLVDHTNLLRAMRGHDETVLSALQEIMDADSKGHRDGRIENLGMGAQTPAAGAD